MNVSLDTGKLSGGRLYQRVAEQLAVVISQGEYPPGSRLPAERKLAERFEVSRPTIREAIIALELAGCVEVRGGSGVYICDGESDKLASTNLDVGPFDILEARILFEGEAAELAAKNITADELAEVRQALNDMVTENEGEPICEQADENFHMLIARATKNDAIVSVCNHLWALRNSSPVSARILEKVRQAGSKPRIEEHKAILEALEQRDPEGARAAMREHLTRVIQQLLDATEAEAVEEARRAVMHNRERFNLID
ncbi:FadR/GntR family transcriptional regulator [Gilvimarinus sp. SDUM040013]|uniref:FadR/GntR family transcriptional regulator n=1 Tax=Gilvimarinus gilvus TaxID=3058038 RepID=A0ABU4S1Q1_9GAMM|nr:FadR/GntR family transcriptional regulator [Gilvimarinus sp. SDUM040013]MDO3386222.1 FadR/GntR family transcriptional regulator [Gilvimarinus sp. SDUM040013]MDX6849783.1 FadR/GntR family transcriptional regulator [Gilvimarinus sp. SDUM040013]